MKIIMIVGIVFVIINLGLFFAILVKGIFKKGCPELDNKRVGNPKKMLLYGDEEMGKNGRRLGSIPELRIAGGSEMVIKKFPFIGALVVKKHKMLFKNMLQCSCVIITPKCALTAAHCIKLLKDQGFNKNLVIIHSNSPKWNFGKVHRIQNWSYHEKYNEESNENDIGLIKIKDTFNITFLIPIAIKSFLYHPNLQVTVAGWGWKNENLQKISSDLLKVNVKIFNQTYCKNLYFNEGYSIKYNTVFCAGDILKNKGACAFDSGGPAINKNVLVGIVSWGIGCGRRPFPTVFTRIALYHDWIINKKEKHRC